MDILRPIKIYDGFQQRHKPLAIPMAVLRKFGNDQAGNLAVVLSYYAFFSLLSLLLVMTTILGFVLQGHPGVQKSVEDSVLGQFPVIGDQIQLGTLAGHTGVLAIGVVTSILGGLGVTQAAQNAFSTVWAVPRKDRPDFLQSRLRGLLLLACLGLLFILDTAASGLVTGLGGTWVRIGTIALSTLVNFAVFLAAFRFLTAAAVPTSCLWIGVAFAAVFWEILQIVGGIYINHVYRHAQGFYSQFALVIALIVWLHLGAQVTLYAAEINVVLARRLYPRSLLGPPQEGADQRTLRALAKMEERHDEEEVEVQFHPPAAS